MGCLLRVGLTGNLGSGKSTVLNFFRELGAITYDADKVIHSLYRRGTETYMEVVKAFGEGILKGDGQIDRKKLAEIVFRDKAKLRKLEEISHRALYNYLEGEFKKIGEGIVVVEATLLMEKGSCRRFDFCLLVYAPKELCKERALKKGYTEEEFERRWSFQFEPQKKKKLAHFIIDNSNSLEETRRRTREVFRSLKLFQQLCRD